MNILKYIKLTVREFIGLENDYKSYYQIKKKLFNHWKN